MEENCAQVSVIIPTFNRDGFLPRAIQSVLAQTLPAAEIIVVDDGSTDQTRNVLGKMDGPIRYIYIQHSGVSAARNAGIRAARCDWIAFLDSDDRWHPTKLERQFKCLERTKAKVCFTACVTQDGKNVDDIKFVEAQFGEKEEHYFDSSIDLVFWCTPHPFMPSLLVQREALRKAGLFDESLFVAEDTRLIYNLALQSGVAYINTPLVTVAQKGENSGLSDNRDPRAAAKRYNAYLRVQSEAYWRLLEIDYKTACLVRKRLGLFISRRAELACALDERVLTRTFAREGLLFSGHWRIFARCLILLLCPILVRARFRKKWYAEAPTSNARLLKAAGSDTDQ